MIAAIIIIGLPVVAGISNSLQNNQPTSGNTGEGSVALCDEPRSQLEALAETASGVLRQNGIDESGDDILKEVAGLLPSGGPCAPWFAVYIQQRRAQP